MGNQLGMLRVCGERNCSLNQEVSLEEQAPSSRTEHRSQACWISRVGQKLQAAYSGSILPFFFSNTTYILIWVAMCPAGRLHLSATLAAGMTTEV